MTRHSSFRLVTVPLLLVSVFIAAGALVAFRPGKKVRALSSFLFISDIHLNSDSDSTWYGGDTGKDLWRQFLSRTGAVLASPASPGFIVYTGDIPAHYSCHSTCYLPPEQRSAHNADISTVLTGLQQLATRYHKPLFYLPGNNDALAGDYYSFADEQQQTALSLIPPMQLFFPHQGSGPFRRTPPCMVSAPHPTLGYYAALPVAGLRLIALNTVIYSKKFTAVDGTNQLNDGDGQMKWLAQQLADARANHQKVYIAMHIPPGTDAYSNTPMWAPLPGNGRLWVNEFIDLVTEYRNTIAGMLYGHTHMDELRRIHQPGSGDVVAVAVSCPGVTPQHYNNPGFKTVFYDAADKDLVDFQTHYTYLGQPWSSQSYRFSNIFAAQPGSTLLQTLREMPLSAIVNGVDSTYTVMNGAPTYDVTPGIEVITE